MGEAACEHRGRRVLEEARVGHAPGHRDEKPLALALEAPRSGVWSPSTKETNTKPRPKMLS